MKKFFVHAILVFIALSLSASYLSAHHSSGNGKFTKHFNGSLFRITENDEFSIELILDEKEYKIGSGVIGIVIHDRHDGDVEGAEIEINYAGMIEKHIIKEKGEGLYLIEKLNLKREGRWELQLIIKKTKITDKTTFVFPDIVNRPLPAGKYTKNDLR